MNTSKNTKVGILIPTYNRRTYLEEAFKSATGQSYKNIEIIVIDNGAPNGTARSMADISDSRVRYVLNERNIGMIGSINKGIGLFSEHVEWCTVLCDDDILHKDYMSHMMAYLEQQNRLLVAYGHIVFTDEKLNKTREAVPGPEIESAVSYLKARTHMRRETYLSSTIFQKNHFLAIRGYPPFSSGWATDDALIFHLAAKGHGVGYNKSAICSIRVHEKAESVSIPGGLETHFKTALDLKNYCRQVALTYGLKESVIDKTLDLKIKGFLYSLVMIHYKNQLKFRRGNSDHDDFLRTIRETYSYLPFRIKFDYQCYSRFGIALERYWPYTMAWEIVGAIYKLLRTYLPLHRFIEILHTRGEKD